MVSSSVESAIPCERKLTCFLSFAVAILGYHRLWWSSAAAHMGNGEGFAGLDKADVLEAELQVQA